MKELRQLIQYLTQSILIHPRIIRKNDTKTQVERLYHHIKNQKKPTAETFFPNSKNQDKYFNTIKNQLEEKLINSMLFVKPNAKESQLEKSRNKCYKLLAVINQLRGQQFKTLAAKTAKKGFKIAVKYEFTNLIYEFSSYLQSYHGLVTGNIKKLEYYTNIADNAFVNLAAEKKAQTYMTLTSVKFVKSKTISLEPIHQTEKYIEELEILSPQISSTRFHLLKFNLMILVAEIKSEHQKVIEICDEAYLSLKDKEACSSAVKFLFRFKKIPSLILYEKFGRAEEEINACLEIVKKYTHNYNILQIYKAFLGFHQRDMSITETAILDFKSPGNKPHPSLTEAITILEAYFAFETNQPNFNTNSFPQKVPTFSKDKRGNNINILIAQILFLIKDHAFDAAEIRINALQSYAQRNLIKDADFRSNCFIKLLSTIPEGSFNKLRVKPRAAKYLKKLSTLSLENARQPFELEIIKYEILWEKIFLLLD